MDHIADYPNFKRLVTRLCATFDRAGSVDELVESYWKALRNSDFAGVERAIERAIANAGEHSRMPRPAQLRPQGDDAPRSDDGGDCTRDYWRSVIVANLRIQLCFEHRCTTPEGLESYIAANSASFEGLRVTLDQLCDLERKNQGQRTDGLYELALTRVEETVATHRQRRAA